MMKSKVKQKKKETNYIKLFQLSIEKLFKNRFKNVRNFSNFRITYVFFFSFFSIATFDHSNDRYSFRNSEPINDLPTTTMPAGIWLRKLVTRFIVPLPISTRLPVHREYHPPHVHLGNGELYRGA